MDYAAEYVSDEFLDWYRQTHLGEDGTHPCEYLTECLTEFVLSGEAINKTGGDFALFLRVVIMVIDRFLKKPEDFGEQGRQIKGVIVPGRNRYFPDKWAINVPNCLDPDVWNVYAYNRHRG